MRHRIGFFAVAVLLAGIVPAGAAEIAVKSKIDKVTVFQSGAEIARVFEAAIEAGSHVLVLADLPAGMEANSVRVDGEAGGTAEITSIDARQILVKKPSAADGPDETERKRIDAELLRLTDERAGLDGIIAAAEGQKALAENLSRLPLASTAKSTEVPGPALPDWNALFDLIGARLAATAKTAQDARIKQRDLDERIAVLREQLRREPPEEWERTEIRIHIDASAPAKASLRLRYQVAQASWEPIYDARLTTGGKSRPTSLVLARRASISQNTGEDWNEAKTTLSTARPGGTTAAPELASMKVMFRPERRPGSLENRVRGLQSPPAPESPIDKVAPANAPMEERKALVDSAPYQAAFNIAQTVTVKSGVGQKKVLISAEEVYPAIVVLAVPKLDATAYLHAKFTHDGLSPLLPGAVSLYRDGVYVGQGTLPLTLRGEEKELGFGPDDGVKVARVELKRAKGESGIISTSATDEQHFKITVKNSHDWTVPITIIDQLPVAENEQIAVETLPMTTEPSERNYGDKLGVLAWMFDLEQQKEKEITLSYEIKWPAKREITVSEY
jgi:uncharacterized protein (TIGR02231 family)